MSGLLIFLINKYYYQNLGIYNYLIGAIRPLLSSYIYSLSGFLIGSRSILKEMNNKKCFAFILIIPAIILRNKHEILFSFSMRFKNIVIDIVIICLFIFFASIPFESIKRNIVKKIIKQLTSYTGGI